MACELLVAACTWDLFPWPGMEPGSPALGARSLNHCGPGEVPAKAFLSFHYGLANIFSGGWALPQFLTHYNYFLGNQVNSRVAVVL